MYVYIYIYIERERETLSPMVLFYHHRLGRYIDTHCKMIRRDVDYTLGGTGCLTPLV